MEEVHHQSVSALAVSCCDSWKSPTRAHTVRALPGYIQHWEEERREERSPPRKLGTIICKVFSIGMVGNIVFLSALPYRRIVSQYHDTMGFLFYKQKMCILNYPQMRLNFIINLNFDHILFLS
jgi:hypothetical protein